MKRYQKVAKLVDTNQVLALAASVYRMQSGYFKDGNPDFGPVREANKRVLDQLIQQDAKPLDQDIEFAQRIKSRAQGLVFKELAGTISEFDRNIQALVLADTVNVNDRFSLGILSYTPEWETKHCQQDEVRDQLMFSRQEHLAPVGDKVSVRVRVLRTVYSQQYNRYFITGLADSGHQVFFAFGRQLAVDQTVDVQGWVKAHKSDFNTQLNRVRIKV